MGNPDCKCGFCQYNTGMEKKTGRPPIDPSGPMGKVLQIRLTDSEREDYAEAAERAKLKLSAWMRDRLNRAVKRELRKSE